MVTRPISMFDWLISVILSSLWSTVTGALTVWLHFVTGEDWTPVLCWWGCYSIDGSYGYSKTYQTCFHFKRVLLDLIESLAQKLLLVFNGRYSCFWLQREEGRGGREYTGYTATHNFGARATPDRQLERLPLQSSSTRRCKYSPMSTPTHTAAVSLQTKSTVYLTSENHFFIVTW